MIKTAIDGYGRIGRGAHRVILQKHVKDIESEKAISQTFIYKDRLVSSVLRKYLLRSLAP